MVGREPGARPLPSVFRYAATSMNTETGNTDPSPFQVLNPEGSANLLLVCDHASCALPARYGNLGLSDVELHRHIGWDIGAARVAQRLAQLLDAPAVLAGFSRLLVDYNRQPDDPTLICMVSDWTIVPGNRHVDAAERAYRLKEYFDPYHAAIAERLTHLRGRVAAPVLVSIHSFTPAMKGIVRPWHVGILWNHDPRLPVPLLQVLTEDPNLVVGDNQPYSGRDEVGYTNRRHGEAAGLPHVMFEIRQDLLADERGVQEWADRIAAALRRVMVAAGPFEVRDYRPAVRA